jgi:sugar lactone lactonase YvrE
MSVRDIVQAAAGVSTGNPNAWDVSKAYYDAGSVAGDISKAVYASISFSVASQDTSPADVFFKPDGSKMYMIGGVNDSVYEYTLSTPLLVTSSSYVQSFSVTSQDTSPSGLFFKPDGTKMYVSGAANDSVYEYSLSSAWDISTASYVQSFSVATEEISPQALFFKPDGTKMYVIGTSGDDVNEYDLSTAWDISTASYLQNFSVATEETSPIGISFLDDGTKMYVIGSTGDDVNQYDLSTPWDVSTASYVQNFSVAGQSTLPQGLYMKGDGSLFYMIDATNDTVYQYFIGGFSVAGQDGTPEDLFFKPDGTKMYISGNTNDSVFEYDLSTAWDINSASYVQSFSVTSQEPVPNGIFFKDDGTKMYVTGATNDKVNEYSLSVAWDVSTASYVQNFNVASQTTGPAGLAFKDDGTKMYVLGNGNVNEYSLSTAWNVSSASYSQNFSVTGQEGVATALAFGDDGSKMYVIGQDNDTVFQYALSTAWDVSTASYVQGFNIGGQETAPRGLFFNPDGEQFFVVGPVRDRVFSYSISEE